MAIKDLNNKQTGDKLHAKEWNDVMNEILAHFSNKRIHLDMIITSDNELIYTDENNIRHQYVLQTKNKTWGEIYIYKVMINDQIEYNEIPSSGILDANIKISIQQYHNGEIEDISEFTLTYTDFEGNEHTLYDDSSFIISIPYNYTESEVDRSLNVRIEAHELVFEGLIPLIQLADEIDFYGNVNIVSFICEELNYEANSSVTPSLQYKQSIIWKSGRTTNINSGLNVNYTLNTDDPNTSIDNITGQITKITSNETYERISLGTLLVRVSGNNNKYDENQINIYQASLTIPNLIYGQVPIVNASELEEFVVNPENNINDILIDGFNKVSNFTEGKLTIESTANDNEYVALCFLIKDINKNLYKVTTIPGLGDLHDEFSECGFNIDINYKDTYTYNNILYKLYISFFERINSNETNLYYIASNKKQ